jgi:hypothetical protein
MNSSIVLVALGLAVPLCGISSAIAFTDMASVRRREVLLAYSIVAAILSCIGGGIAFGATSEVTSSLMLGMLMFCCIMSPLPAANYVYTSTAKNSFLYGKAAVAWATENFSQISGERDYFIAADVQRMLRDGNIGEDVRKHLSYLDANIVEIGQVVDAYRTYNVTFKIFVMETPATNTVYGIKRSDLNNYLDRLRAKTEIGGWLPSHLA